MSRVVIVAIVGLYTAACGGGSDSSDPETPPEDRTSAAICSEDLGDVAAAWADFAPTRTVRVCPAGCDAVTIEDGVALACDGDGDVAVSVGAGVYPEALYLACPGQRLHLHAENPPATAEELLARPESERAILDGAYRAPSDCSEREHGALQIEAARAVWIEGLELRGYHRACANGTAYGVVVQGDGDGIEAVRVDACYIHDLGVACPGGAATCDGDLNGHGVLVIGVEDAPIRRVDVSDNRLEALSLGQSEALALNGHVERFTVTGNRVRDVDNIGIDVIGLESGLPWQAREGLVRDNDVEDLRCGNPTYASDTDNDPCPDGVGRWPAAAGIYVDGAHGVCVAANRVRGFDRGLEVASERGSGDRKASAVALCGNRLEASREHALTYGGSCGSGSNGARDVRAVANTVVCADGDAACREVDRDAACT
ncbi:MAG: hypothetical protein EP329_28405, partial [Deltaproteobacteria bacterium]